MNYFLAPALVKLRDEVNSRFPGRDKASDGWIGDASHQASKSDHNPCWSCSGKSKGIVRALDIDISPDGRPRVDLRRRLLKILTEDSRVWYVISNGKIYSRTNGFAPRTYTGANGHFAHVHVSLNGANGISPQGNFSTRAWFPKLKKKTAKKVAKKAPAKKTAKKTAKKVAKKAPAKKAAEPVGKSRLKNFRESRPDWDVKILDRMYEHGRRDMKPKIDRIESAVADLPDDLKESRVQEFKEIFKKRRILKMSLLNEAVRDGRSGRVKIQRDKINTAIKSVIR